MCGGLVLAGIKAKVEKVTHENGVLISLRFTFRDISAASFLLSHLGYAYKARNIFAPNFPHYFSLRRQAAGFFFR